MEWALYYLWFSFSPIIEQRKQVYNYEANDVGVMYNEWTNHFLHDYRHLLTNRFSYIC